MTDSLSGGRLLPPSVPGARRGMMGEGEGGEERERRREGKKEGAKRTNKTQTVVRSGERKEVDV